MKTVWILVEKGIVPSDGVHETLESLGDALAKRLPHFTKEDVQSEIAKYRASHDITQTEQIYWFGGLDIIQRTVVEPSVRANSL